MRYRGLNIEHQLYSGPHGVSLGIVVYDGDDDLRQHSLYEMIDIDMDDPGSLNSLLMSIVDDYYDEIISNKNYHKMERYKALLGRAITCLTEFENGENLYNTLSESLGFTDDEIRSVGLTNLVPFFDKEGYAQTIAEYMTDNGTNNTLSGNYRFDFSVLNNRFGINLPEDRELLNLIVNSFDDEIISSCEIDNGFELTFYTDYCPNYYEEYFQNWG